MPILITKTLQGELYNLYILTEFSLNQRRESVDLRLKIYRSKGHFQDEFLPIIQKQFTITNRQFIRAITAVIDNNGGSYDIVLNIIETELVSRFAYLNGAVVEPRDIP